MLEVISSGRLRPLAAPTTGPAQHQKQARSPDPRSRLSMQANRAHLDAQRRKAKLMKLLEHLWLSALRLPREGL